MTKLNAKLASAKLAARNMVLTAVFESAKQHILEDSRPEIRVDLKTGELTHEDVKMVLNSEGFNLISIKDDGKTTIALNDYFKALQQARIKIDEILKNVVTEAFVHGKSEFRIDTERDVEDQEEIKQYLEMLGYEVRAYNKTFFCKF